jgi:hypothetical protein
MDVNGWAVLVATATSFVLGGSWYSPVLFGKPWNRANGSAIKPGHPAPVFAVSIACALPAAFAFAYRLDPAPELGRSLLFGLTSGLFFVAASLGINFPFASRSPILIATDGGYHTVQFRLFGLVLGLWHWDRQRQTGDRLLVFRIRLDFGPRSATDLPPLRQPLCRRQTGLENNGMSLLPTADCRLPTFLLGRHHELEHVLLPSLDFAHEAGLIGPGELSWEHGGNGPGRGNRGRRGDGHAVPAGGDLRIGRRG